VSKTAASAAQLANTAFCFMFFQNSRTTAAPSCTSTNKHFI